MTACVNCAREVQPAWKYCIYCGTRTPVVAPATAAATAGTPAVGTAPRSRPLPKRTPVPGYAAVSTAQSPIVPVPAPAPLSAAPVEEPVSSAWPETMGERPTLRSALAATEVPAPTPPREDAPAPEGEADPEPVDAVELEQLAEEAQEPELDALQPPDAHADLLADEDDGDDEPLPEPSGFSIADLAHEDDFEDEPEEQYEAFSSSGRMRRGGRNGRTSTAVLDEAPEIVEDDVDLDDEPGSRRRSVNVLAVLALAIGVLACPLAALFGHLALGQLKVSGERGVIPAWAAVVLGYLWLGFWIVFGVTYFAANG